MKKDEWRWRSSGDPSDAGLEMLQKLRAAKMSSTTSGLKPGRESQARAKQRHVVRSPATASDGLGHGFALTADTNLRMVTDS